MINFTFVPNGNLIIFRCPKIWAYYSLIVMCLNIRTPNNHHFPFGTNEKVVVLGVPILRYIRIANKISYMVCKIYVKLNKTSYIKYQISY